MHSVPQPSSSHSAVPPGDTVLCSFILDCTLVVNEEQATDGVGVAQPTCVVIHEEYEWELEHEHLVKDDSLPSEPPLFLPNMISHVYLHLRMHPLLITYRTHRMSAHHLTMERINYSLKIHLTFHMLFSETQSVNLSASHLPLCLIH